MITVIDYGMGNAASIANMIKHIGGEAIVSSDISFIEGSNNLILPGVGAFDNAVKKLKESGLYDIIKRKVNNGDTKLLGICLGMQLLFESSEEGVLNGFGFISGKVKRFSFDDANCGLKIPHIGWNTIQVMDNNDLFDHLENLRFYFVHSYHAVPKNDVEVIAMCDYGYSFACAVKSEKVIGVQFHPEKSHKYGMQFFKNYLEMEC
jgi:glutamine amidotransferase